MIIEAFRRTHFGYYQSDDSRIAHELHEPHSMIPRANLRTRDPNHGV